MKTKTYNSSLVRMNLMFIVLISATTACQSQTDASRMILRMEGKEYAYPRISKNGDKILFQSNEKGHWQLMIYDTMTRAQLPVMEDDYNNNFPDWSADNAWIAFASDRDGNEEIYMMRTDGSMLRRLTNDPGRDIHPYFSPDGRYLLFNSTRGNGSFDIYRYTIATGELIRLTDTPENETCARFSPNMKQIVFLKNDDASDDVFIADASLMKPRNLTQTPSTTDGWPMFSPDGQWIYWSSRESGTYHIYKIRLDGTSKQKLTWASPGEEDARVYIAADGSHFIYNKGYGTTIEIREMKLDG